MKRRYFLNRVTGIFSFVSAASLGASSFFKWNPLRHEIKYEHLLSATSEDMCRRLGAQSGPISQDAIHPSMLQTLRTHLGENLHSGGGMVTILDLAGVSTTDGWALQSPRTDRPAFVWNNVGTWQTDPRSRREALEWAQRHLPSGGIYVDADAYCIPTDLDYSGFELLSKGSGYTVFRKI